jgi:hypothetical protein
MENLLKILNLQSLKLLMININLDYFIIFINNKIEFEYKL